MRAPTGGVGANLGNLGLAPAGGLELPEQPSVGDAGQDPASPQLFCFLSLKLLPKGKETEMIFTLPSL